MDRAMNTVNEIGVDKEEIEGLDESTSDGWGEYPLDTVFVRTEQRTVADVVSRIKKRRYQLDPDFQRDFVWPPVKQSRLIESSLMRIPLPVFYVAEDVDGKIIVVDGLQRLTTFYRFINNEFALKGIESSDSTNIISGKKFDQLPIHLQERIEDTQLTLYILDPKAPERARLDIFERVNSGMSLTKQQMRNCLYTGQATAWLKKAAQNKEFLKATGKSLQSKTMRDREVINRFCAFYLFGYEEYKGDMEEFLALALRKMNTMSSDELDKMMLEFRESMIVNHSLFGEHAFRKSAGHGSTKSTRTVINISLFDVFSVFFAKRTESLNKIDSDFIKTFIQDMMNDAQFNYSISSSTNNTRQVRKRFEFTKAKMREAGIC